MADALPQTVPRNAVLASLLPADFALLSPHLERHSLDQGMAIEAVGQPITQVHFPEPGVVSVVARSGDMQLEAGLIGPEGMTGLAILHGVDRSPNETIVQIPCRSWRMPADALWDLLGHSRSLHLRLLRYAQAFTIQLSQTVLVNGRFTIDERLARWLLMCHDRADREDLPLTHEFLSIMLGVRRAGVTTALQALGGSGALALRRSTVIVRSRRILEEAAGDAYGVPEAEYVRLMEGALLEGAPFKQDPSLV